MFPLVDVHPAVTPLHPAEAEIKDGGSIRMICKQAKMIN